MTHWQLPNHKNLRGSSFIKSTLPCPILSEWNPKLYISLLTEFLPLWHTISHLSSSKCYFHLNLPEAGSAGGSIGSFPVSSLLIGRKARWPSLIGWLSARGARRGMRNDGQDVITMSFTENSGFAVLGSLAKNLGNHFRSGWKSIFALKFVWSG